MFILKLPENKKSSVLGEVLEPNPIAAKQINHIATLTDFTSNVLKACAVANVAKFILYEDAKKNENF